MLPSRFTENGPIKGHCNTDFGSPLRMTLSKSSCEGLLQLSGECRLPLGLHILMEP